jgi:NADPH-dependent F420 reductase
MKVAILGGTGPFGRALAVRLHEAGDDVTIGSRESERASAVASELGVRGKRNEEAVGGVDLVVLAVDAAAALETARSLRRLLQAPLLSVASELTFAAGAARPSVEPQSLAERVAELLDVAVTAGLHSLAAGKLARGRPDEDALVCGDDAEAKALALELAGKVVAGRAVDAGPLACARALEGITSVLVNVNRRYKAHAGLRLTGLP